MDPRPSRPARQLTVALALVCLTAQLSGTVHLALVTHVTCAEHGELVEPGEALAAPEVLPPSGPRLAEASPVAREAAHGHDHCLATALRRAAAFRSIPPAPPGDLEGHRATLAASPPVARAPAIPLLAVAPKCSPPAA